MSDSEWCEWDWSDVFVSFIIGLVLGILLFAFWLGAAKSLPNDVATFVCQQDGHTSGRWDGEQVICVSETPRGQER